eukprot:COSAG01_NODE_1084_length_11806_cov_6.349078_4_plen_185_part_00
MCRSRYSKKLLSSFDEVLSVILLLHTGFSLYLISVAGGTQSSANVDVDLFRPHVAPMLIAFVMVCSCFTFKLAIKREGCRQWARSRLGPLGARCVPDKSHKGEDLEPFSVVYSQNLLCNEDDDYDMDEKEHLLKVQTMFAKELEKQLGNGQSGLDASLYQRLRKVVQDSGVSTDLQGVGPTRQP